MDRPIQFLLILSLRGDLLVFSHGGGVGGRHDEAQPIYLMYASFFLYSIRKPLSFFLPVFCIFHYLPPYVRTIRSFINPKNEQNGLGRRLGGKLCIKHVNSSLLLSSTHMYDYCTIREARRGTTAVDLIHFPNRSRHLEPRHRCTA